MSAVLVAGYIVGSIVLAVGLARGAIEVIFHFTKPFDNG